MSTGSDIKQTVVSCGAAILTIYGSAATIVATVGWWIGDKWSEYYRSIAVINAVYMATIVFLVWIIFTRKQPDFLGRPNVRSIQDDGILIVDGSPWLSIGVMAAIYIQEDEYERLACEGEVLNVQSNGLVQIRIANHETIFEDFDRLLKKLAAISKQNILIRPGLYRRIGE